MCFEGVCNGNLLSSLPGPAGEEGPGDFMLVASLCHDPPCPLGVRDVQGMSAQLRSPGSALPCLCRSQESSGFHKSSPQHLTGGRCSKAPSFLNCRDSGFPASSLALSSDRNSMAAVSASTKAGKLWGRQGDVEALGQAGWRPGGSPAPLAGRHGLHIPVAMLGI